MEHVQARQRVYDSTADSATAQRRRTVCAMVGAMLQRWRTRQDLLTLTDAELRDVGLTWTQAREEGSKPFWRR